MNNAHARATTDGAGFKVLPRCDITWRILFAYWPVFVTMGPADPRLWFLRILHSGRRCAIQRCSSKEGRIQHSHWQSSAVFPASTSESIGSFDCRPSSRRSALERAAIQSGGVEFRVHFSLVTDFRATCSPLTSGKHLPGITNVPCSGSTPQTPFCFNWARVPVDVGSNYAMWAAITVNRKMLPTSERNRRPHQTESGAHIEWNRLPTSTGIRIKPRTISPTLP